MRKFMYKLQARFLTWFGSIKLYKWPMFVVYDPTTFSVPGRTIMDILEEIRPGDILLRGYKMYADGMFVPGTYSHGGIYVGDGTVIHAVSKGVSRINVVEFCECDKICLLRPNGSQEQAIALANRYADENVPYDFAFKRGVSAFYCFELCAECYRALDVRTRLKTALFGLIRKSVYLDSSFLENPNFEKMIEFLPD